jgi:penicillin-binding protein 1A
MDSMLRDVTIYGTAARASATLKRAIWPARRAPPTNTSMPGSAATSGPVVGCSWIGFDQPRNLGNGETGGASALPIWIGYMAEAR